MTREQDAVGVERAKVAGLIMALVAIAGMAAFVPRNSVDPMAATVILLGGVGIGITGTLIFTEVSADD